MTTILSISFLLILGTSTALAQHPASTDRCSTTAPPNVALHLRRGAPVSDGR